MPWCPPGGAAGDARPRVSLASHTFCLIFLGTESGLLRSREVGRECPVDGRGHSSGCGASVFWARAGWQDGGATSECGAHGARPVGGGGPPYPWAVAEPSASASPFLLVSLLHASLMKTLVRDVGPPLPLRARPLLPPGWCLSPAHLGELGPSALSCTHPTGQVRGKMPRASLGHVS